MKPKTMILMVVAVGCGLGASIMTSRLLADRRDKDQGEATTPVLVAKAKVTGWTELKEPKDLFEAKEFPVSLAPKGAIGDLDKIKGKKLNKNVGEGYALTETDVLSKEQASIADQLLPGQRATAIKVTAQSAVGGFVLPGSRVDIVLTSKTNGRASARTVLQHVLVMAIDNQDTRNSETKSIIGQTVTLAATPLEANRLQLAASLGDLTLQVKNPGDNSRIAQLVIREEDLDRMPPPSIEKGDEVTKPETTPIPSTPLPVLPPEEEKKEETKPVEKPKTNETPKAAVAQVTPKPAAEEPKPKKRHVMHINQGIASAKVLFLLGEKDPDEEDEASGGALIGDVKREDKSGPKPTPAPEKKEDKAVADAPQSGKVSRTRR